MIIIIFLVCIGVIVLGGWLYNEVNRDAGGVTLFCGISGGIISFLAVIVLCFNISQLKVIDERIEMYQIENANIQTQIAECVEKYQEYETQIFAEVAPESAITLVSIYPELKADTLVSKQIEIYLANNREIKELKELKISEDVYRWWLYFGASQKEGVSE